jgi:hypothetical protein
MPNRYQFIFDQPLHFGASKLVASNNTAKGRAENRRTVVIHVRTIYEGEL